MHARQTWTTRDLLSWTTSHFQRKGLEHPRLTAEMLLAHVLHTERIRLYMDPHRPTSELERAAFRELVERAAGHEPVDYLIGQTPFYGMVLKVTPAVLVPRPSTETLVEHIVDHARRTPGFKAPRIADVGTGSGAIAVALAKQLPEAFVVATDLKPEALEVARDNARNQEVSERIDFRQGDLLEPLGNETFHFLASNPPYISDREWEDVPRNVKGYEPVHALRGGREGMDYLRPLIEQAHRCLRPAGQLVLEIAASQKQAVLDLAAAQPALAHPRILQDHEQLPRVLVAERR